MLGRFLSPDLIFDTPAVCADMGSFSLKNILLKISLNHLRNGIISALTPPSTAAVAGGGNKQRL